ncbi:hypothetical protein T459_19034 [Capsicum annuum]|uniref:Integrase catalytic domain-containing protein n=1 Tax=Capsicum annuum TaxID=4072 RepID=A0A2G2Z0H3_CAPAN|nr:hypothetical protein T459_19034 [Capsicum annuum]
MARDLHKYKSMPFLKQRRVMSEVDVQFRKASPGAIFFNPMNFGKSSDIALHPSNKSPILSLRPSSSDTFHTVNDWHRSGKGLNKLFSDSSSTLLFLDEVLGDNLEVLRNLFDYLEEWIGNETDNLEMSFSAERLPRVYAREIVHLHGVPISIILDQGSVFTSSFWRDFQDDLGTHVDLSTSFHPQTDRQSEWTIEILKDIVRAYAMDFGGINDETAWVQAGATLGEIYYNIWTKSEDLGSPVGIFPTIGIGGYVNGGGYGNMLSKFGLNVDNVLDAQLVDVNGRSLKRKSMGEDVLWEIKGGVLLVLVSF